MLLKKSVPLNNLDCIYYINTSNNVPLAEVYLIEEGLYLNHSLRMNNLFENILDLIAFCNNYNLKLYSTNDIEVTYKTHLEYLNSLNKFGIGILEQIS